MARTEKVRKLVGFIWSIAELLRGDYKQADYGKVILPFTVLRRLDCILEPTKVSVMDFYETKVKSMKNLKNPEPLLNQKAGVPFHNISQFTFQKLKADPDNLAANLKNFINGFSAAGREIIEYFNFNDQINRLDEANLLFLIVKNFAEVDLHPKEANSTEMGYVFEELIRKFSELSNETAGEHFTPREVIRLMVNLLFINDKDILIQKGIVKTIYDPACGTGGMLSVAEEYIKELNEYSKPVVFGQELNPESYAICKSDMLIKGQDISNIKFGNTFTNDGLAHETFDYMLSNPPFGVEWKKVQTYVKNEYEKKGFDGRFGAGLPRISDGSFLFLQHMISKMKLDNGGSRIAIVFNGSPLFSGSAGSGESEIRKWLIENDMLEAIVAMPDQLFYNTGIYTYIWIVTNCKVPKRKGKIQLVNGIHYYKKMTRSLGNKRNEIGDGEDGKPNQIAEITCIYGEGEFHQYVKRKLEVDGKEQDIIVSKIFDNEDFGYWRITVERPLRLNFQVSDERIAKLETETAFINLAESKKRGGVALREIEEGKQLQETIKEALRNLGDILYKKRDEFETDLTAALKVADVKVAAPVKKAIINALAERDETADICIDKDGNPEPDSDLRDYENVPLKEDIDEYMKREVLPHVPDAWVDGSKTKIGYEIPFTRHFYEYVPPRPLEKIEQEIKDLEDEIQGMLKEVIN
ncbi:restriction endonuclease subunit M [Nostoc sp. T09]|uniref:type I restriction-modification system subunit M n=1 Tax=Nostoc sp. T09 TaxID=1932621 RepID=UPI000A3C6FBB|nr:class I SAM-dependent DNA methyltransferase [Nostoc sp. T09]OUL36939.1 restriction endonuclease subunit M [Nostoc sp. T09]